MKFLTRPLFKILFFTICFIWLKCIWDVLHAFEVWPNSGLLPTWFQVLFVTIGILALPFAWWCLRETESNQHPRTSFLDYLLWLSIPIAVICVCPVCYQGNIFTSSYPVSTFIRQMLIIVSIFSGLLYFFTSHRDLAIFVLLIAGYVALIPNDRCNNEFNYWYVQRIEYSPLMYIPVVVNILLVISAHYNKNKTILNLAAYAICVGCIIISFGHRLKILW